MDRFAAQGCRGSPTHHDSTFPILLFPTQPHELAVIFHAASCLSGAYRTTHYSRLGLASRTMLVFHGQSLSRLIRLPYDVVNSPVQQDTVLVSRSSSSRSLEPPPPPLTTCPWLPSHPCQATRRRRYTRAASSLMSLLAAATEQLATTCDDLGCLKSAGAPGFTPWDEDRS